MEDAPFVWIRQVSHYRQYPPGTQYACNPIWLHSVAFLCFSRNSEDKMPFMKLQVYSYFESRGCDREGWTEVCFFGHEPSFAPVPIESC